MENQQILHCRLEQAWKSVHFLLAFFSKFISISTIEQQMLNDIIQHWFIVSTYL